MCSGELAFCPNEGMPNDMLFTNDDEYSAEDQSMLYQFSKDDTSYSESSDCSSENGSVDGEVQPRVPGGQPRIPGQPRAVQSSCIMYNNQQQACQPNNTPSYKLEPISEILNPLNHAVTADTCESKSVPNNYCSYPPKSSVVVTPGGYPPCELVNKPQLGHCNHGNMPMFPEFDNKVEAIPLVNGTAANAPHKFDACMEGGGYGMVGREGGKSSIYEHMNGGTSKEEEEGPRYTDLTSSARAAGHANVTAMDLVNDSFSSQALEPNVMCAKPDNSMGTSLVQCIGESMSNLNNTDYNCASNQQEHAINKSCLETNADDSASQSNFGEILKDSIVETVSA